MNFNFNDENAPPVRSSPPVRFPGSESKVVGAFIDARTGFLTSA